MGKEYEQLLTRVRAAVHSAAARGDPLSLLEALSQEKVIGGLVSRLHARWRVISYDDLSDIICFSIDKLFYHVRAGKPTSNPMGFLWITADHKAQEFYRRAKKSVALDDVEQTLRDK